MTQERQTTKNFFRLNGGLNTEINELNFPDGFSTDEANYELLVDGSRRRRKGLAIESGAGAANAVAAFTDSESCQIYLWRDAGGLTDVDIMVYRQGNKLHFATADETVSDGWYTQQVDLESYETSGATTANTDDVPVTFSQGRGYLFVSGLYIKPLYITFDGTTTFTTSPIEIKIRDYVGAKDGVGVSEQPVGTITETHRYNLRNRGWSETELTSYGTDLSKHPPKNAIWYKGFKRTYGTNVSQEDGVRSWDSTKLAAEGFGASSAPVGSLFIEPSDTTIGFGGGGSGGIFGITTWSFVDNGATWDITATTSAAHSLSSGAEFTITGNRSEYSFFYTAGEPDNASWDFNGLHTAIAGTTGSTLKFTVDQPARWDVAGGGSWTDQYNQYGTVDSDQALDRDGGTAHPDAPRAIEFYAGRVFYAGMQNQEFNDYVFFSQIADDVDKFNKCYQEADPTDERFNALTSADGGYIVIPGMSGVMNMVAVRNSLIIFAKEGIWEVSGGQRGVFTADGYSVRKITDIGCNAPIGQQKIEDSIAYTGPGGISILSPNQFTGLLEATSASEQTIQTLWNQIPDAEQLRLSMAYDSALRRLYLMYGPDGTGVGIDTMLIFDARAGAWFKYTFDTPTDNELLAGFAIPNADDTSEGKKMKFIYKASATTVQVADFAQTDFNDWDGTNGPLPYLVTGHDSLGDWQSRRQAPLITVFSKRTETGYTDTGNGFDPVNESSTLLTPYWDWTNDSVSNKIGTQIQVYRHTRNFVPSGTTDVDGYPVVVTRNKIRGRGRALQIRFDGATDKDSHILGFTTNYKVSRKK